MASGPRRRGSDAVLLEHLAHGATLRDAAKSAGMSERSARRHRNTPEFQAAEAAAVERVGTDTALQLSIVARSAVAVVAALLGPDQTPSIQLRAADIAFRHSLKLREGEETQRRLAALESFRRYEDTKLDELLDALPDMGEARVSDDK